MLGRLGGHIHIKDSTARGEGRISESISRHRISMRLGRRIFHAQLSTTGFQGQKSLLERTSSGLRILVPYSTQYSQHFGLPKHLRAGLLYCSGLDRTTSSKRFCSAEKKAARPCEQKLWRGGKEGSVQVMCNSLFIVFQAACCKTFMPALTDNLAL